MRPVVAAAATSGVMFALGDITTQFFVEKRQSWDSRRTARFGVVGLLAHGPYFYAAFAWIERSGFARLVRKRWSRPSGSPTLFGAAAKAAFAHATVFPPYVLLFLAATTTLEIAAPDAHAHRADWSEWANRVKEKAALAAPTLLQTGTLVWVPSNTFNFYCVPPGVPRVFFVNVVGVWWNAYCSHVNAKAQIPQASATT